ncbi:unnamed protein product [Porites lobata]|uniref:Insulin-like domain-containing protein n=1 Tax=Porites lobata TaxID=104759 RepID=A0ABN8MW04_9CNID|nr:unnamed protein product [Porites lobata]
MNGCVKFLLLMYIVVGFVQVNFSAGKQYDIKHCWGPYEFHKLLENHCSFHVGKRSIRREDLVKSKIEANGFLNKLARRESDLAEAQRTTYTEECCFEGCKVEEIAEYCGHLL